MSSFIPRLPRSESWRATRPQRKGWVRGRERIDALIKPAKLETLRGQIDYVVPVIQVEGRRFNALPVAMATRIAAGIGAKVWLETVQLNVVGHTTKTAAQRFLSQPEFGGAVPRGSTVIIVDDVVTMGSTLANLRGYLMSRGARVASATTLGAGNSSTKLVPSPKFIKALEEKFGKDLGDALRQLGFKPQQLTVREVYFLNGLRTIKRFRSEIAEKISTLGFGDSSGFRL
jgi:Phosphoribosyl transferase domain